MNPGTSRFTPGQAGFGERPPPPIPDHKLLRPIASGGYGEVWLAQNLMGTYRAVKVVYRGNFAEERPYLREFEGIQRFEPISREHPGFVDVLQVGRNDAAGFFYYVMELADDAGGELSASPEELSSNSTAESGAIPKPISPDQYIPKTLRQGTTPCVATDNQIHPDQYTPKTLRSVLRAPEVGASPGEVARHSLPINQCLAIASELAGALHHLHEHKLVHRDIKPANIIFVKGVAKLADIGLVTLADTECSFVGTEGFVAREGPGRVQADIYALGKVLYEMTTGLSAKEFPALPDAWASSPQRIQLNAVNQVILHACEGDAGRRYASAAQMRADLDAILNGHALHLLKLQRSLRQARQIIAGTVAAVVFIGLSLSILYFKDRAAQEDRRRVLREMQISQMQVRHLGWFSNSWSKLERAATIKKDQELVEQTAPLLAGWDGQLVQAVTNTAASSAAFSPDGRLVVTGAEGDLALLLDTNGVVTRLASRSEGPVCWTRRNEPIQLTIISNRLVLRDLPSGGVRREFKAPEVAEAFTNTEPILAISLNGDEVAAATGGRVLVWNSDTGRLIGQLAVEPTAMAFAPDGSLLGCGDGEGIIRVYSMPSSAETAILRPTSRGSPITSLAFTLDRVVRYDADQGPRSWLLAAADQGTEIVIWDLRRQLPRTFCRGAEWTTCAVAFSPDGLTLASSTLGSARLWDVASGRTLLLLPDLTVGATTVLAFDPTGRWLVCGGLRGAGTASVGLISLNPDHGIYGLAGLAWPVRNAWFSPNSELLAALTDDWHIGIWRIKTRTLLEVIEVPTGATADCASGCFDPTSKRFVFSAGTEAVLYEVATGDTVQRWKLPYGLFDQLQWDSQGRLLLLRGEHSQQMKRRIWRLYALEAAPTPRLLHEQTAADWIPRNLAIPLGAKYFMAWSGGPLGVAREIHVYDTASGRDLWHQTTERRSEMHVYLDPSGETFGYSYLEGNENVRVMRFSDFTEVRTTASYCAGLAPSGREFATTAWLLPDKSDLKEALPFDHDSCLQAVFSPNGRWLAGGRDNGTVYVADTQQLRTKLAPFMPE
jgi:serine/threonine protein kinase/WD40 repeat protein